MDRTGWSDWSPFWSGQLDRIGIESGLDHLNRRSNRWTDEPVGSIDFKFFFKKTTSKRRRFGVLYKKIWKSIPLAPRDTHSSHRCWKSSHPPPSLGGHTTWSYQREGLMGFERASHPPLVKGLLAALSPSLRPFPSTMETAHRLSIIDSDGCAGPTQPTLPIHSFNLSSFLSFSIFPI